MCLAIPACIITVYADNSQAIASVDGVKVEISLALLEDVQIGDYVLVHVGYALQKIDEDEARKTLALFSEVGIAECNEIH